MSAGASGIEPFSVSRRKQLRAAASSFVLLQVARECPDPLRLAYRVVGADRRVENVAKLSKKRLSALLAPSSSGHRRLLVGLVHQAFTTDEHCFCSLLRNNLES